MTTIEHLYDITPAMPDVFPSVFANGEGWRYQLKFSVQILWELSKPELITICFGCN